MRYDILKYVVFPYIIHVIAQKGKLLSLPIYIAMIFTAVLKTYNLDRIRWYGKTANFKMSYLMTYICYLFKNWRCYF